MKPCTPPFSRVGDVVSAASGPASSSNAIRETSVPLLAMTPTMNGDGGRVGHRLLAVDALRGVAAMAVVLYHVPQAL